MKIKFTLLFFIFILFGGNILAQAFDPAEIKGFWRGFWYNYTFQSTDSAFLSINYNSGTSTLNMVLDLEGSVFGGSNPDPVTLTGNYNANGFLVTGNNSTYGDIFINGYIFGIVNGRLPNVPNPAIDSTILGGVFTPTEMSYTYIVYFTGGADTAIGVISLTKDQASDVRQIDINPNSYQLYQNYPNPFNPVTNIQFAIKDKEFVTLVVYDVLGNTVATLINEEKSAGTYNVDFDASSLPSGIYFYHIQTKSFAQTKKMVLMK